jgi:L-threonylcarbamoyladenylate synthase
MAEIGLDIEKARTFLADNVIGIPTETVYGLAANAFDARLVAKIFEVKNRPTFDPLIVHAHSTDEVIKLVKHFPLPLRDLADAFWPGPLTLLLPKSDLIPDIVTSGLPQVAVRIPAHALTLDLLRSLPFPLAAPSANPFGYVSPTTAKHVTDQLGQKIPYVLDGGPCRVGLESTIVGIENNCVTVYRLGGLQVEQIEAIVGNVQLKIQQHSNPSAPGMLDNHYAPSKQLFAGNKNILFNRFKGLSPFIINFQHYISDYAEDLQLVLSPDANMQEAAVNLFSFLRIADQSNAQVIIAELLPDLGLGKAINDRLERGSFKT